MRVTTMPDISGVIIFFVYFNTRLISISTLEAAMKTENQRKPAPAFRQR